MRLLLLTAAFLASLGPAAFAQEPPAPPPAGAAATPDSPFGNDDFVLEIGGGPLVQPAYLGSSEYEVEPNPLVDLHYLRIPGIGSFGGAEENGFIFSPSFNYVGERKASDYHELRGLENVDAAIEIGATVGYRFDWLRAFVTVRRGFGGHNGYVGEIGLDAIAQPTRKLTVSAGPRVTFADTDYLETYLGVKRYESLQSGLAEYHPGGGIKGVGVEGEARYALTDRWSVVGSASYERLVGDAADSPITKLGSDNQFTAALGLTYRFGLDLFP